MTRRALKWMLVVCGSFTFGETLSVPAVRATPASGFAGSTVAHAGFAELDVKSVFLPTDFEALQLADRGVWLSTQKTKGPSELYLQSNTWQAGGATGWHSHPGHSLVIVTKGTITVYEGDDPSCTPHVYGEGDGLVDIGGGHVHMIRNETSDVVQTMAVQIIPAEVPRRLDAPDPGTCPF